MILNGTHGRASLRIMEYQTGMILERLQPFGIDGSRWNLEPTGFFLIKDMHDIEWDARPCVSTDYGISNGYDFGKAAAFRDRWIEVEPRPNYGHNKDHWGTKDTEALRTLRALRNECDIRLWKNATDSQIERKRGIQFPVSRWTDYEKTGFF